MPQAGSEEILVTHVAYPKSRRNLMACNKKVGIGMNFSILNALFTLEISLHGSLTRFKRDHFLIRLSGSKLLLYAYPLGKHRCSHSFCMSVSMRGIYSFKFPVWLTQRAS